MTNQTNSDITNRLDTAKSTLLGSEARCVVMHPGSSSRGDAVFGEGSGISPLIGWLDGDRDFFRGAAAADRVIGRAAALLFAYGGITAVWGEVMSRAGAEVFDLYGIKYGYGKLVDGIKNRAGDGPCPMETRAAGITSPGEAYEVFSALIKSK